MAASPSSAHPPAQAFWITGVCQGELRSEVLSRPGADDVVVRTRYSGISRGTELLVYRNRVPPSQYGAMRCPFQDGDFPAPVKYGYAAVGTVVDGPAAIAGRTVFVLHPHQDRFVVPAAAVTSLPETVPPERAVLAANMETALNVVWDAGVRAGDRVCIIGAGVVGLLVAHLAAAIPAVEVTVLDVDPAKAAVAGDLGLDFTADPPAAADFDVVVHASGQPDGLVTALGLAAIEATIVEASWFGDRPVTLPLGHAFHSRRLTIRSSQVGAVAASQRARWDHRRRLAAALRLLADPRLDRLIDGESPFADLPSVMAALSDGTLPALCHRIRYP
jgi:2-desacetyl-2-hydroxyethyl bacteriochlorophyllide A dehydrogenase